MKAFFPESKVALGGTLLGNVCDGFGGATMGTEPSNHNAPATPLDSSNLDFLFFSTQTAELFHLPFA